MRVFRRLNYSQTLQIDAICINQQDDKEKGRQVSLMGEVYRLAKIVQVWLGAGAEQTAVAIAFLSDLAPKAEPFGILEQVGEPWYVLGWPSVTVSGSQA